MKETLHRYPGAQPFHDDELSRQTFFGREAASLALTDQILANRLLVVYAKSGLGKTSLLNAGVAPRLREAGSIPLFVRMNDIQHGPLSSIFDGVKSEADRQGVEYVAGSNSSLWALFKTAELWRDDLLLTPVLIIDQFEELFTLQSAQDREKFLAQLGFLLRGVAPSSQEAADYGSSDSPPVIRVVLSLREDFLGLLEEASDQIPAIMDNRYRVSPLDVEMAAQAITGPAAIEREGISTRAFRLEPECVQSILNYLTKFAMEARGKATRYVEPFHLQLICQRIESIVAFRQMTTTGEITLTFADVGGEKAMGETLRSFYANAILTLPRRYRSTARKMCERFLISREGRRLSVEERELCNELRVKRETLRQLVEQRLLRTDRRVDSTYYELSHDALVLPVLASRQTRSFLLYTTSIFAGSLACLSSVVFVAMAFALAFYDNKDRSFSNYAAAVIFAAFALFSGALGFVWLRAGIRRRSRYGLPVWSESDTPLLKQPPIWKRTIGWIMLLATPIFLLSWGGYGIAGLGQYIWIAVKPGSFPEALAFMSGGVTFARMLMHEHPIKELLSWTIIHATIVLFAWWLFWQADHLIWPQGMIGRSKGLATAGVDETPSLLWVSLKLLSGGLAFAISVLGFFTMRSCNTSWHGQVPYWVDWAIISPRLSGACDVLYQHDWNFDEISFAIFFGAAFVLSIVWLVGGAMELRTVLRYRRVALGESGRRQALVTSGIFTALLATLLASWAILPAPNISAISNHISLLFESQATSALLSTLPTGWAAGNEATIVHTENDGRTWESQNHDKGMLSSIAFSTRELGFVVGSKGTMWRTDDGGKTWDDLNIGILDDLEMVTLISPRLGWAVGENGLILHTTDSGKTWAHQSSHTKQTLRGIAFTDARSGWAVGDEGTILHTSDGGQSWKTQRSGTKATLNAVTFPSSLSGWSVGAHGLILQTVDGGRTWSEQGSGILKNLYSVAFVTPESGWVAGQMGFLLHTEDGGKTWGEQGTGSQADLTEISFVSPLSGWAVSAEGSILHTSDGGRTWASTAIGTGAALESIAFLKPYGLLGISSNSQAPTQKSPLQSSKPHVTVAHVTLGGPASRAGLRKDDGIEAINGEPVKSSEDLMDMIYALKPGVKANLTLVRGGKQLTMNVVPDDGSKVRY